MGKRMPSLSGPILLLVVAVLLTLGPLWGVLGTVVGMIRAFGELNQSGEASSEALASHIDFSLWTTIVGLAMSPVGIVLLVFAITWIVKVNRKRSDASSRADG